MKLHQLKIEFVAEGFRHEQAVRQADFSRPYEEVPRERPLGSLPILAGRIQTRNSANGNRLLSLLPLRGTGVHPTLDDRLLHSLCKLLQDAVAGSDWDTALRLPWTAAPDQGAAEVRMINLDFAGHPGATGEESAIGAPLL